MFGLESERRVQGRYNLSETTLQQSKLRGMAQWPQEGFEDIKDEKKLEP